MNGTPRVALFADTFYEVNGAARTCRECPAVVMDEGGPRFIVSHGVSGMVAANDEEFCQCALTLAANERLRREMGRAGRRQVESQSWDRVFEEVYEGYRTPRSPLSTFLPRLGKC